MNAFWNHHYMVGFTTLIALAALLFQPLGGAMFTVRDTWVTSARKYKPTCGLFVMYRLISSNKCVQQGRTWSKPRSGVPGRD